MACFSEVFVCNYGAYSTYRSVRDEFDVAFGVVTFEVEVLLGVRDSSVDI